MKFLKYFLQIKKNGLDLRCGVACATGDVGAFPELSQAPGITGESKGDAF